MGGVGLRFTLCHAIQSRHCDTPVLCWWGSWNTWNVHSSGEKAAERHPTRMATSHVACRGSAALLTAAWVATVRPKCAMATTEAPASSSKTHIDPAIASAAVAIGGAAVSAAGQWRGVRLQKRLEAERESQQREADAKALRDARRKAYAEPLAMAAHDLQARLYAIVESELLQRAFTRAEGSHKDETRTWERAYAVDYTCYLIAQFLAWLEIVRQEEPRLALPGEEERKRFRRCVDEAEYAMRKAGDSDLLWIYQGVMRAIGEVMVVEDEVGNGHPDKNAEELLEAGGRRRSRPLGFAAFMKKKADDPSFQRWFQRLEDDLLYIGEHKDITRPQMHRIAKLQDAVLKLVEFLDEEVQAIPNVSKIRIDLDKYTPVLSKDEVNTARAPKSEVEEAEEAPPPPSEDEEELEEEEAANDGKKKEKEKESGNE